MTQCEKIVDYIRTHGKITRFESFTELFITELPARICDLKRKGFKFEEKTVSRTNSLGEKKKFTEYSLIGE